MHGVPIYLQRDGEEFTAWLSTRRSGEVGQHMLALRRSIRKAEVRAAGVVARMESNARCVEGLKPDAPDIEARLDAMSARQEELANQALACQDEILSQATELACAALTENHGEEEAKTIIDLMNDAQIRACMTAIETGDAPADFFPRRATPPSGSTTSPADDSASVSSSSTASDGATSKPGTSK